MSSVSFRNFASQSYLSDDNDDLYMHTQSSPCAPRGGITEMDL